MLTKSEADTLSGPSNSPHDEHWSSGPRPVKLYSTSTFFSFYLELYKNKSKNLIRIRKFKCSFRGLTEHCPNQMRLFLTI